MTERQFFFRSCKTPPLKLTPLRIRRMLGRGRKAQAHHAALSLLLRRLSLGAISFRPAAERDLQLLSLLLAPQTHTHARTHIPNRSDRGSDLNLTSFHVPLTIFLSFLFSLRTQYINKGRPTLSPSKHLSSVGYGYKA